MVGKNEIPEKEEENKIKIVQDEKNENRLFISSTRKYFSSEHESCSRRRRKTTTTTKVEGRFNNINKKNERIEEKNERKQTTKKHLLAINANEMIIEEISISYRLRCLFLLTPD